jgi:hypothetical protein
VSAAVLLLWLVPTVYQSRKDIAQGVHDYRHRNDVVTVQQQSAHMIKFLDEKHDSKSLCSATAIGPHALLTATHCNEGESGEEYTTVNLDLSPTYYHLLAEVQDSHDHVIYILDGPVFKHFLPVDSLLFTIPPSPGEHVYMFGDGESNFPPRRLDGVEDAALQAADSDVDADMGMHWYTLPITHGDSGAAIFGEDNRVLGCNTWADGDNSISMSLNFTKEQIQFSHDFTGDLGDDNTSSDTKSGSPDISAAEAHKNPGFPNKK